MGQFYTIGASAQGKGHIINNIPCQDAHAYKRIENNWGLMVVCDGAGSCENSQIGSDFISKAAIKNFSVLLEYYSKASVANAEIWRRDSLKIIKQTKDDLVVYCIDNDIDFKSVGSTLIVLLYSKNNLYTIHIGDGRAAYRTTDLEWHPAIEPYSGEYVGETVFITSNIWEDTDKYIETNFYEGDFDAFTAISDGAESFTWEYNIQDPEYEEFKVLDTNKPFAAFFNPNISFVKKLITDGLDNEEINKKWLQYLSNGNERIENEPDDRTIVLSFIAPKFDTVDEAHIEEL